MREVLTYRLPDATQVTLRPATPDDAAAIIAAVRSRSEERSYVLMDIYGKDAAAERAYLERLDREPEPLPRRDRGDAVVGLLALLDMPLCSESPETLAAGVHLVARVARPRHRLGAAALRPALGGGARLPRVAADIFTTNERSLHLFRKAGFREEACRRRAVRVGVQQINEIILARSLR